MSQRQDAAQHAAQDVSTNSAPTEERGDEVTALARKTFNAKDDTNIAKMNKLRALRVLRCFHFVDVTRGPIPTKNGSLSASPPTITTTAAFI